MWTIARLPSAVCVPLAELQVRANAWDRAVPILVVCRTGVRSRLGCSTLIELGFTHVTNLTGGLAELNSVTEVMR